ncbi:MAG TPA: patatin-like phospholipase family protein [Anaeromyxobacteraceae bacterium]|nr:patatin-like phospholipase family protein [Anaeromyxobacteraceae bacterium]
MVGSHTVVDIGIVLTGGGARAAYQVGVLRAIAELWPGKQSPFSVFTGVSAGAINAISIAAGNDEFHVAASRLTDTWNSLTPDRVYRTDARGLLGIGSRWIKDLSAGGLLGSSQINYLLDTAPLGHLLAETLPVSRLGQQIRAGTLRGVAISTTSYATGLAVSFFDGVRDVEPWFRTTRIGVRQRLRLAHVLASSAIPLFFPPVNIRGLFYGDGCVRMHTPLSPAIHLGADRIVAIGVQSLPRVSAPPERAPKRAWLPPSEIAGLLLNAIFLDALEADVERLERVNRTVSFIPADHRGSAVQPLREIPALVLRPSQDLGTLAADQYMRFPRMLRYLLKGIGATGESGSDLLSYLAFEHEYVGRLIELGYADTMRRRAEVVSFLEPALSQRARAPG